MIPEKKSVFWNWAKTYHCKPEKIFLPRTESELQFCIAEAARKKKNIRVAGSGHSWSPLAQTTDWQIQLSNYQRYLGHDANKLQLTVQSGIQLKHLTALANSFGWSLPNLGSISEQSISGATATGTHGTGIRQPMLANAIVAYQVILPNGNQITVSETENAELLPAYRLHLGCLGVISAVTVQCVPYFRMKEERRILPFDHVPKKLTEWHQQYDRFKIWWFPHGDECQLFGMNPTLEEEQTLPSWKRWLEESFLTKFAFTSFLKTGQIFPASIPFFNKIVQKLYYQERNRIESPTRVLNVPNPPIHYEMEYAIPAEHAPYAIEELPKIIEQEKLKINFIVEIRFTKGDDTWLSPAYQQDVCFVGCYLYGNYNWEKYCRVFDSFMSQFNGRPHWGKQFLTKPEDLRQRLPQYNRFIELRRKLDPENRFLNEFLANYLQ
ncbi:MAG: FAD-binding protein [Bacteroidia bacterium]|nr:FAD-binding protein [Bacteroidia bacterium]